VYYDTTQFLAEVRLRAGIPTSHPDYTDAVLLRMGTNKLLLEVSALIRSAQEDFAEAQPGSATDTPLVALQRVYDIPARALTNSIIRCSILKTDGVTEDPLERVDNLAKGRGYFLRGNTIVLTYDPTADGSKLRIFHDRRPNRLVTVAETRTVTAVAGGVLTLSAAPPASWSVANRFDFVRPTSPFVHRAIDVTASVVGPGATMTVPDGLGIAVGDYVSLAEEACVPQVPEELHELLMQVTANVVLRQIGPPDALAEGQEEAGVLGKTALKAMQPRASEAPKRVSPRTFPMDGRR
jgi:hypothetical protein